MAQCGQGDGNADVALTWALVAAGTIPAGRVKATVMGWGRSFLITSMLDGFDVDAIREQLPAVVEWKASDPHMSAHERAGMWALVGGTHGPRVRPTTGAVVP